MSAELQALAQAAGCLDLDVLAFADATLPTAAAQMADLRARKPQFFGRHVKAMSPAEYAAERARLLKPRARPVPVIADGKHADDMSDREYQRARAAAGVRVSNWRKREY